MHAHACIYRFASLDIHDEPSMITWIYSKNNFWRKKDRINIDWKRIKRQRLTHTTALGSYDSALTTTPLSAHAQTKTHDVPWQSSLYKTNVRTKTQNALRDRQFKLLFLLQNMACMYIFFVHRHFSKTCTSLAAPNFFNSMTQTVHVASSTCNAQLHEVTKLEPISFHIPYFDLYNLSTQKSFVDTVWGQPNWCSTLVYIGSSKSFWGF